MKCIWCNGFPEIYAQLEEAGWGQFAMGICALCYIYVCVCVWCNSVCLIGGWGGVNLQWVYVHCAISTKFGVMVCKASMVN